jgi:hypothetical protein
VTCGGTEMSGSVNQGHRDLAVWQESMTLAKGIYVVTSSFLVEERFGLVAQMRRCDVSVPS